MWGNENNKKENVSNGGKEIGAKPWAPVPGSSPDCSGYLHLLMFPGLASASEGAPVLVYPISTGE